MWMIPLCTSKNSWKLRLRQRLLPRLNSQVGQVRTELHQYKLYQELVEKAQLITTELAAGKLPHQSLKTAIEFIEELAGADSIIGQTRFLDAVNVVIDLLVRGDHNSRH